MAQSLKVREQNAAIKILSAVDHLVDQSVSQATLPQLDAEPINSEKQPSSPAKATQVDSIPTQAPLTPSQPVLGTLKCSALISPAQQALSMQARVLPAAMHAQPALLVSQRVSMLAKDSGQLLPACHL